VIAFHYGVSGLILAGPNLQTIPFFGTFMLPTGKGSAAWIIKKISGLIPAEPGFPTHSGHEDPRFSEVYRVKENFTRGIEKNGSRRYTYFYGNSVTNPC
jgi:hypothetical protein